MVRFTLYISLLLFGLAQLSVASLLTYQRAAQHPQPTWISFAHDNNLYKVRPDGSHLTQLTSGYYEQGAHSWSPDGRWIVFSSYREAGRPDLFVMRSSGQAIHKVTQAMRGMSIAPDWSPDGESIIFDANIRGLWSIYQMPAEGGTIQQLVDGFNPAWSSDGTQLAYGTLTGRNTSLSILDIETHTRTLITTLEALQSANNPTWSNDNHNLAFVGIPYIRAESKVYIVGVNGSNLRVLSSEREGRYLFPAWSPDGQWIAYIKQNTNPPPHETRLYKVRTDGSQAQPITTITENIWNPVWSPIIDMHWRMGLCLMLSSGTMFLAILLRQRDVL